MTAYENSWHREVNTHLIKDKLSFLPTAVYFVATSQDASNPKHKDHCFFGKKDE